MSFRQTLPALLLGLLLGAAGMALLPILRPPPAATAPTSDAVPSSDDRAAAIWAISLVRARPGQRQRLLRFLRANWLELDQQLLEQGRISRYRLLEADAGGGDGKGWDYAVILEYRDRQAMDDFVPAYLALLKARPQVRIDGLSFADLGEVVQQKVARPLGDELE